MTYPWLCFESMMFWIHDDVMDPWRCFGSMKMLWIHDDALDPWWRFESMITLWIHHVFDPWFGSIFFLKFERNFFSKCRVCVIHDDALDALWRFGSIMTLWIQDDVLDPWWWFGSMMMLWIHKKKIIFFFKIFSKNFLSVAFSKKNVPQNVTDRQTDTHTHGKTVL